MSVPGLTNGGAAPSLNHPTQIAVGSVHACALTDDGVVYFGDNSVGQTSLPELKNVKQVVSGYTHNCALTDDGVTCWGSEYSRANDDS